MEIGEDINITISGKPKSGRSTFLQLIAMELIERGMSVNIAGSEDKFKVFRNRQEFIQNLDIFRKREGTITLHEETVPVKDCTESILEVERAKEVLRKNGYYVDALWSVSDVRDKMKDEDVRYLELTDEQCLGIISGCVSSDYIVGEINSSIKEEINLILKEYE